MTLDATMHLGAGAGPVMLMFHGYGNDADEMTRILRAMYPDPRTRPDHLSLRAPHERPYLGGRYWYPHGCDAATRRRACDAVAREVAMFVDAPLLRGRRLMLMGFSQGGYLAYRIARAHPGLFDTAILLSPSFVGEGDAPGPDGATRFVLCYGTDDDVIPREDQRNAYDCLRRGGRLTSLSYEGMGHTVCDRELEDIRAVVEERR